MYNISFFSCEILLAYKCYNEKDLFWISYKSELTKIETRSFYFCFTNLSEFRIDISMPK